jgi:FtsP/CotA-like multicopper oxidase with cupredoxin domain
LILSLLTRVGHYSAQYAGGALGPVVIHGPITEPYDIDLGPVLVSDHFHQDYFTLIEGVMAAKFPPSNNNLINGKMNYPCENTTLPCTPNAGISKFRFQSGKKHLLRIINTSAEGTEKFSIDNHTLTVIANDFIPIVPYTTNVVTLGVAQRADIIVEANGKPGDAYWMRSQLGTQRCTLNDGISPNAVAAVYYELADETAVPDSKSDVTDAQLAMCKNDALNITEALCKIGIAETPATFETIDITFESNGTNFIWFMNNSSFRGDFNSPILLNVNQGNDVFEPEW